MNKILNKNSACRLNLPVFRFVDVYRPLNKERQILSSFTADEVKNKATEQSIAGALDNLTK